jgi:pilus assembly protein CpaF
MQDVFEFKQTGTDSNGKVQGDYHATGNIPFFIEKLRRSNSLKLDMGVFVPKV